MVAAACVHLVGHVAAAPRGLGHRAGDNTGGAAGDVGPAGALAGVQHLAAISTGGRSGWWPSMRV